MAGSGKILGYFSEIAQKFLDSQKFLDIFAMVSQKFPYNFLKVQLLDNFSKVSQKFPTKVLTSRNFGKRYQGSLRIIYD